MKLPAATSSSETAANKTDIDALERRARSVVALFDRIRELEDSLNEALNWWSADMPDYDENRDRLRKIAEKGAVIP